MNRKVDDVRFSRGNKTGFQKQVVRSLFAIIILATFYVLSIGPAYRLMWTGKLSSSAFQKVYAPVNTICGHSSLLARLMDHYYLEVWYSIDRETSDWLDDLANQQEISVEGDTTSKVGLGNSTGASGESD